jgi:hypothetical protein
MIPFLLLLPNITQAIAVSMNVDSYEKSVYPGETAFFIWIIRNEDDVYTIDFHISSDPETIFNITDFTLGPGEEQKVNQSVETLKSDENGTRYKIDVILTGEYYISQPIPGQTNEIGAASSSVFIIVLNESVETERVENKSTFDNYWIIFGILSLVVVIVVFLAFYIWRKKHV